MKPLFLALLFALLGLHQAGAQATAPAPQAVASPAPALHIDSVAVLRQVYRRSRLGGGLGASAAVYEGTFGASSLNSGSGLRQAAGGVLIGVSAGSLVLNIVRWSRYSRRHEAEAVLLLQHGQPLPHYAQGPYLVALTRIKAYVH